MNPLPLEIEQKTPITGTLLQQLWSVHCIYCDSQTGTPSADHLVPRSKGGGNGLNNLAPCCKRCNSRKNAKDLSVFVGGNRATELLEKASKVAELVRIEFDCEPEYVQLPSLKDRDLVRMNIRGQTIRALANIHPQFVLADRQIDDTGLVRFALENWLENVN